MPVFGLQSTARFAIKNSPGTSVRTALVYEGELAPTVQAEDWFDYLIPANRLFDM